MSLSLEDIFIFEEFKNVQSEYYLNLEFFWFFEFWAFKKIHKQI